MTLPIDSLATYIAVDLAIGALGTAVFEQLMPDAPDTCVTVYDSGGGPPALTQGDNTDSPSFQIICRSLSTATALANDQAIFQGLHGITQTTLHGTLFKLLWALQSNPVPLGRDEKQRVSFARNYRAYVAGVVR